MNTITRNWRVVMGGAAAGSAALIGFAGASASAEPVLPVPPSPATITQTVTVTPRVGAPAPGAPAAAAAAAPLAPATTGTLADYLGDNGVSLEPQRSAGFTALTITLPMPTGWTVVPDPNVPDAFAVIADRAGGDALYTPNAQLMVYKLDGDFDAREAISHGYVDSQKLPAWQSTNASMADFGGFPSSLIEGTYRENELTLNTSRRHVIVESGSDRYLLSLFVTTAANQVVATSAATDGIVNGFRVGAPAAAAAQARSSATAQTPAPAPPPAAAQ